MSFKSKLANAIKNISGDPFAEWEKLTGIGKLTLKNWLSGLITPPPTIQDLIISLLKEKTENDANKNESEHE